MSIKRLIIPIIILLSLASAAGLVYYRRQTQPFTVFDQPQLAGAECVRTGCGGQLCVSADQAARYSNIVCEAQPEHSCYQQANCHLDRRGKCSFETTSEISDCLQQVARP